MVTRLLDLAETPRPADAADALALAICHLWRGDASSARPPPRPRPRTSRASGEVGPAGPGAASPWRRPVISFVRGTVARSVPRPPWSRSAARPRAPVHARHAGDLRVGHAATLAATLVVREDSMTLARLRRRRRALGLRDPQTVTGVGPRLAQSLLRCSRPTPARRRRDRGPRGAHARPRRRPQGCASASCSAQGPPRCPAGHRRPPRASGAAAPRRAGPGPRGSRSGRPRGRRRGGGGRAEVAADADVATCSARRCAAWIARDARRRRPRARGRARRRRASSRPDARRRPAAIEGALRPARSTRSSASSGSRTSSVWCSRPPPPAAAPPTTCCWPDRPGLGKTTLP